MTLKKIRFLQIFIWLIPGVFLLILAVANIFDELYSLEWDWDVDHWMYFGYRLTEGNIMWDLEFDNKLLIVQLLFYLPAKLQSVRVWQWMSITSIIITSYFVYLFVIVLIKEHLSNVSNAAAKFFAFISVAVIAASYVAAPGGISQINSFASGLAIISIVLVDYARRASSKNRTKGYVIFLIAALCASVAIGIRPYYLPAIGLAGFWVGLKTSIKLNNSHIARKSSITRQTVSWLFHIGVFGVVVNVLPYFITGQGDVFFSGLSILTQDTIPRTVYEVITSQIDLTFFDGYTSKLIVLSIMTSVFILIVGIALLWININDYRIINNKQSLVLDVGYLLVLCPILVEAAILAKHFWPHYLQLFIPFIAITIGFMGAVLLSTGKLYFKQQQVNVITSLIMVLVLCMIYMSANREMAKVNLSVLKSPKNHHYTSYIGAINEYRLSRPKNERDFINPSAMYIHWKIREPRHGFPVAAVTSHIIKDMWKDIKLPKNLIMPITRSEYCEMLEKEGPSIVVEVEKEGMTTCFTENLESNYKRVSHISSNVDINESLIWLFVRNGFR